MAFGFQQAIVVGNLGRDPEMRYTQSGTAQTTFSLACTTPGGEKEETEWFNVVAWQKTAETANQYLTKGRRVLVLGRIKTRSWEDKESGVKKYRTELIANDIKFMDSRQDAEGAVAAAAAPEASADPLDIMF